MADFLDIFGEDFSSVLASLDELPPEVETMLLGVMDKMVYDVKTFSNSLEKSVYTMQQAGTSPKIIKQTLANDMGTGGRIFGQLRNDTKASIVDGINQSAKMGQYKNYDLDKGEFVWVAVGGHKVCMDCDGRAGQKMTFAGWEAEGLPGSGWSVCQGFCYCVLDPTGKASKKIDAPVREPGPKVKPVKSTEKLKNWFATENKNGNKLFYESFKDSSVKFQKFLTSFPRLRFISNGGSQSYFSIMEAGGSKRFGKYLSTPELKAAWKKRGGINIRRWKSTRVKNTIRHEMGHYLHEYLHQPKYTGRYYHDTNWKNFKNGTFKNLDDFIKKNPQISKSEIDQIRFRQAFESVNERINKPIWGREYKEAFNRATKNLRDFSTSISNSQLDELYLKDLFGAITRNNIGSGHSASYYGKGGLHMQMHETFANLTWAYSSKNPTIWKFIKKELPELATYYEGVVEAILTDGNFQTII